MDELAIAMKAREFVRLCGPPALPVSVDAYAAQIGGVVQTETLQENEDAWSFQDKNGKYRFSVCHEVAHVVLEIGADHSNPSWSYSRRPPGEVACDVFAAELLLPYKFKPRVNAVDMGSLQSAPWPTSSGVPYLHRFTLRYLFSRIMRIRPLRRRQGSL